MRRLLKALLVLVLPLVLVFYAGGGWYFSGRIRTDALDVKPYPPERNLTLAPLAGGLVKVRSSDAGEQRMLDAPSTYGVQWNGGYGQVSGAVVRREGKDVVRRLTLLTGSAPVAGTRAEIKLEAWPGDPSYALGKDVRTVSFSSPVGNFPAWLVQRPATDRGTWAVVVHGKGGSRLEMYRMARSFGEQGLSTLDITYRNDPDLPGDPSGFYGYGATEWRDLQAAVQYAAAHGAQRVVLGADSMGGAVVASYLRHRAAGGTPVVGLVLDAPMLKFADTIRYGARQINLPVIGPVPDSLTWTARQIAGLRYDVDWSALDYLDEPDWLTVPTLLFHGTADTTVPIATSRALAREKPKLVTLVETTGVEHVRSWNADPATYDRAVAQLLARTGR